MAASLSFAFFAFLAFICLCPVPAQATDTQEPLTSSSEYGTVIGIGEQSRIILTVCTMFDLLRSLDLGTTYVNIIKTAVFLLTLLLAR
jgi:hypothetical protein